MPIQKKCVVCGKEFSVPPCREKTASTCSHECAIQVRAKSRERKVTMVCKGCGKIFEVPRSHKNRRTYCSEECRRTSQHSLDKMAARVSGDKNPMWNGGVTGHSDGYVYQSSPNHPYSCNGYVFQHRLVVEKMLIEKCPEHSFLVHLGNNLYLSPKISVHHIDGDRKNNLPQNLVAMLPGAHSSYHNNNMPKFGTYWPNDKATENRLRKAINKPGASAPKQRPCESTGAKDVKYE